MEWLNILLRVIQLVNGRARFQIEAAGLWSPHSPLLALGFGNIEAGSDL